MQPIQSSSSSSASNTYYGFGTVLSILGTLPALIHLILTHPMREVVLYAPFTEEKTMAQSFSNFPKIM